MHDLDTCEVTVEGEELNPEQESLEVDMAHLQQKGIEVSSSDLGMIFTGERRYSRPRGWGRPEWESKSFKLIPLPPSVSEPSVSWRSWERRASARISVGCTVLREGRRGVQALPYPRPYKGGEVRHMMVQPPLGKNAPPAHLPNSVPQLQSQNM